MEDYPILNDEFKSDQFEVSINELLFSRSYRPSVNAVSKLLDDNGYFGRYKIDTFSINKHGTDVLIRVHLYLYDSTFTYTWPYNTFFNIDKKMYGHNRRVPRGVLNNLSLLEYVFLMLSSIFRSGGKPIPKNSTMFDCYCYLCFLEISNKKIPVNNWPSVICDIHKNYAQRPYLEKVLPFLCKVGLISNGRFKIISDTEAIEVCTNLFDINYWHNA
jgi:hypothetical protein